VNRSSLRCFDSILNGPRNQEFLGERGRTEEFFKAATRFRTTGELTYSSRIYNYLFLFLIFKPNWHHVTLIVHILIIFVVLHESNFCRAIDDR